MGRSPSSLASEMAPMKTAKAMKAGGKPMTKSDIAKAIAAETELKNSTAGKITIPGVVMIKTRFKPATKACKKEIFGKLQTVKAKPARTVVKAFPVAALKKSV